jgi:hypothetical protein
MFGGYGWPAGSNLPVRVWVWGNPPPVIIYGDTRGVILLPRGWVWGMGIYPLPSGPQFIWWCLSFPFFARFLPLKIYYLLILACGIFASLGPRNVYKEMLNMLVSLIDHVVMNHQNHTRTNGIWDHVCHTKMHQDRGGSRCHCSLPRRSPRRQPPSCGPNDEGASGSRRKPSSPWLARRGPMKLPLPPKSL